MPAICPAGAVRSTDMRIAANEIGTSHCLAIYGRSAKGINMVIGIAHLQPIIALIAGILILIVPRLLNFIVAIYLIIVGLLGLGLFR